MMATVKKKLRCGFTTGTAAAAAVKAALMLLLDGRAPRHVDVTLLTGDVLAIAVLDCRRIDADTAQCSVIKDAGDDPDITHGAEIGAKVTWTAGGETIAVKIDGGPGVGRVTKPGLEPAPGEAAINPGPRRMIHQAVAELLTPLNLRGEVRAEVFVPKGVELARHTLNARLGIVGGISILGTTGIVKPLSHEAYTATIQAALSVARASGSVQVVLTTGRRSERFAQALWPDWAPETFVQIGDYFEKAMLMCGDQGFQEVLLCVFFGKALKMAQGIPHTHARSACLTLHNLSDWVRETGGGETLAARVAAANTARHAFELLWPVHPKAIHKVGRLMVAAAATFARGRLNVRGIVFGFDGNVVFDSGEI